MNPIAVNLTDAEASNLRHAMGISAVGDLYWAAERGVAVDIFAAYGRICRLVGRVVSDVEPRKQDNGRLLIPLSQLRHDRLETLQFAVGAAIRNATAFDSARHWREADANLKGLVLSEHLFWREIESKAREEAAELVAEGRDTDADQAHRVAEIRADKAEYFGRLLVSENW